MYKNREALIKELDEARAQRDAAIAHANEVDGHVAELQNELVKMEATQKIYNDCYKGAVQLKAAKQAFVDAGFSEEEALKIILHTIPGATKIVR